MKATGRKWRDVSIRRPRKGKRGASTMLRDTLGIVRPTYNYKKKKKKTKIEKLVEERNEGKEKNEKQRKHLAEGFQSMHGSVDCWGCEVAT